MSTRCSRDGQDYGEQIVRVTKSLILFLQARWTIFSNYSYYFLATRTQGNCFTSRLSRFSRNVSDSNRQKCEIIQRKMFSDTTPDGTACSSSCRWVWCLLLCRYLLKNEHSLHTAENVHDDPCGGSWLEFINRELDELDYCCYRTSSSHFCTNSSPGPHSFLKLSDLKNRSCLNDFSLICDPRF